MSRKRSFPFCRALPLGLLLCLFVGTAPAFGQETFAESLVSEDLQAVASYGYCFGSELSNEKCRTVMLNVQWFDFLTTLRRWFSGSSDNTGKLDYLGYPQRSMNRTSSLGRMWRMAGDGSTDLALQGTAQSQSRDTWPPPVGGGTGPQSIAKTDGAFKIAGNAPKVRHTTISTTFELMLPIIVEPRFLLTPFAGGGLAHIIEQDQEGRDFSLQAMTMPVLSYGLSASAYYRSGLVLMAQYRTLVFFPNQLHYVGPDGFEFINNDVGTVRSPALMFGVGYRF